MATTGKRGWDVLSRQLRQDAAPTLRCARARMLTTNSLDFHVGGLLSKNKGSLMLRSCKFASRSGLSILVTAILAVAACGGSSSQADEVTVYKIQNRWNQFIFDAGAKVGYDKDGDRCQAPLGFGRNARRAAHQEPRYGRVSGGSQGRSRSETDPTRWLRHAGQQPASGRWMSCPGPGCRSETRATGKYLTCESQRGVVDCDGTDVPTSQTWWLSQWEFVHVGGPKPPKRYRLHEIAVSSPEYCSDVAGDTTVTLVAPGFKRLIVKCWKQGDGLGSDSTVATVDLDAKGNGSFVFPADAYPHGPVTVRISGENGDAKDNCYLQLYNKGGVSWNEGMPEDPPAAEGLALVFADDFNGPFSTSSTDSQGHLLRPQAAGRPAGLQHAAIHEF